MAKKNSDIDQAWKFWIECLKGSDPNSVFSQITTMVWDTGIFRIINEGRKIQVEKNSTAPEINGSLHSFINRNYFLSQMVVIRCLIDRYPLRGRKGVFSIYALLDDIQKYRNELTRETFLGLNNLPYDENSVRLKRWEFFNQQPNDQVFTIPREYDYEIIAETHQTFDRLSNTSAEIRQPDDIISDRLFVRLKEKLAECKQITDFVDKFVAHSTTPESRTLQNFKKSEISLRKLWDAQRIIFEVAEFISLVLFSEGHMALAFELPAFFDYWDKPIFEDSDGNLVRKTWEAYRIETKAWNHSALENTWKWIEP